MASEQRKLVSVVFADVVGSTSFGSDNDPEVVRSVMGSYFERMKAIAETHGGTVEKFIGDAVMVVFGVPLLHDDDAERAVRAALAMRDEMPTLNAELGIALAARVGVNTGEAVTGEGHDRQFLVTGDAVNVAARLQQGADVGEVVVAALTESLTRAAIEYEPRQPVAAKGKPEPIAAFRAVRPRSAMPEQARGLPAMRAQLVGRKRELRLLLDTFERVREERRAHLFTLVGAAGIGKSRLVGEALARIAAAGNARVLRGRCLPYGAGITYWPLIEIVNDDSGVTSADDREAALAKLDRRVAALVPEADRAAVRARLATMLGLQTAAEALPELAATDVAREIAWGVRQYLAPLADAPAVIVIDDLQWAEPPVLDIIDSLAERAEDAPLLLLCVARPQLLEAHQAWSAGRANAATLTLDALNGQETATLISRLLDVDDLPDDLRARVVHRSEGNPLFCEEFLRMLIDEGRVERVADRWRATASAADVRVPESIHAVLAARLDGLAADEKRLLQVASVVGERFSAGELRALDPGVDTGRVLGGLRRKGLVLEDRESREAERYRFKHLLIRDVAHASLPKSARADLHERFGMELEREVGDRRDEFAEILAHHAERAFALAAEVRAPREIIQRRARRALDSALLLGERARSRQDHPVLGRYSGVAAAALAAIGEGGAPEAAIRVALLLAEERAMSAEYAQARKAFERAAELARGLGRNDLAAEAEIGVARVLMWAGDEAELPLFERHRATAEELFRSTGDVGGEIEAGIAGLEAFWADGRLSAMLARGAALLARAREIGDSARELRICARLAAAGALSGDADVAAEYRRQAEDLMSRRGTRPPSWLRIGRCMRMWAGGDLESCLACLRRIGTDAVADGDGQLEIGALRNMGDRLLDERRFAEALPQIERALEASVRAGELWSRTELTAMLAAAAAGVGDLERADRLIAEADALSRPGDVNAVGDVARRTARVREAQGRHEDAEAALRKALNVYGSTEYRTVLAQAQLEHAEFLARRGRHAEAAPLLISAESVFVAADHIGAYRQRIAALREAMAARR